MTEPHLNGEASISERAVAASESNRQGNRQLEIGEGVTTLDQAIMDCLDELGITSIEADSGDVKNKHTGKYSSLPKCISVLVPALRKHGIRLRQGQERAYAAEDGGGKTRIIVVFTDLKHVKSGEVERTTVELPVSQANSATSTGATLTLGRRYSLLSALGLTGGDKDDNGVSAEPRDIGNNTEDSPMLTKLKLEMSEVKGIEQLMKWRSEKKNATRAERLGEAEFERLKQHWLRCKQDLEGNDT